MSTMPLSSKHLKTAEERLARLSVLQELTVTALDLFDPESPADPFLERVAERLGCLAALWVALEPGGAVRLVGAAGLSEASRALPIAALEPDAADPTALRLDYPELARSDLQRWSFRLEEMNDAASARGAHALLLWFDPDRKPPAAYLPVVERLVGVLVTVLAHRRLAQDLRRSYEELARTQLALVERERLAAIGELAAVVAHEVRNPLAVIFNCIGTLQKGGSAADETSLLRILGEEANRLNQIVSDLLEFSRPGEVVLREESIEEIVAGAIAAVKGAHSTTVRIELEAQRPLRPRMVDARLVRRAMINLLTNAVQAMPGGGHIIVRVAEDVLAGRAGTRIEVCDDGPGIPAAALSRIFEPFFTTKASGTGLGLSIVKHNVEALQGDVTVRSDEGKGTTFVIRLPSSFG